MIVAYHTTNDPDFQIKPFLHVGTKEQALMRGGKYLYRISFKDDRKIPRLKDSGAWQGKTLQRHARKAGMVVYLNRHEGITSEEFTQALAKNKNIDDLTDAQFARAIPSAADSWIILDPECVRKIEKDPV